ncbi:restriction endonuclease subunit S [Kitasatospora sp. NBC_01266]
MWARFGDVAVVASNLTDPAEHPSAPHIAPNHIESQTGRLLPYATVAEDGVISAKHAFQPGQILYSKIRPYLAKAVIVEFSGLCSADMYPIDSMIDARYLRWWMLSPSFTEVASQHQGRNVLPKINSRALQGLPVPVPPLDEQRRIVAVLEDHMSRWDRACTLVQSARKRLGLLRDGIMFSASMGRGVSDVSGSGTAAFPTSVGTQDGILPRVPEDWEWRRLGEIAEVVGGVTKDSKLQSDPTVPEVPYLRVANVQRGRLDLATISKIRIPEAQAAKLRLLAGDVLLNEGGDRDKLGRGWIWEDQIPDCIHQNHVFRARVTNGTIHPKLLAWHANGAGRKWFEANGTQSVNLASISLKKVKLFPVPIPPVDLQAQLVAAGERNISLADNAEALLEAAGRKAAALRRALLAQAFSGQLVTQDPVDEPASELLARIRTERAAAPKPKRTRGATTIANPTPRTTKEQSA